MSSKSKTKYEASLRSCLVDGDSAQLTRNRRLRRGSLLLSVILQFAVLVAPILVPLLSKTEPLPIGIIMPMPPYHRPSAPITNAHPHPITPTRGFSFCVTCPPVLPRNPTPTNESAPTSDGTPGVNIIGDSTGLECSECAGLIGKGSPQPVVPHGTTPAIVHFTHLDPAMLIHRVEPVFPTLARQTRREGTVELHAIIAIDGSVRSLQVLEGDALFYQSVLDAVRQWRYKPTFLNGKPVEVDTHITVIYKLNR